MKLRTAGIAYAATLLLALGATAQAQESGNRKHGYLSNHQDRSPEEKAYDQLMREAALRIEQAQTQLQMSLPIYSGHRDRAIEHSEEAYLEIHKALMWDHMYATSSKPGSPRYGWPVPEEQARKSHEHLITAGRLLNEAVSYMEQVKPEYGGYKRRALTNTRAVLQDLRDALRSV